MKTRLAVWSLLFVVAGALQAAAEHPAGATRADIRRLQAEVDLLDDSIAALPSDSARTRDFQDRETAIRQKLEWLRDQVARHREDESQGLGASKAEVEDLRTSIVDLRQDVDRVVGRRDTWSEGDLSIPGGTAFDVRLDNALSSRTARREDRVQGTVVSSVRVDGRTVIPAGATVRGFVQDVEPASRPSHGGRLELRFDEVAMPNGRRVRVDSRVASLKEEGFDKKKTGLGAILGGVLGGVLEGGKGAVVGAIIGGGGAVVASKGDDVELPAGTVVSLRLESSVAVR